MATDQFSIEAFLLNFLSKRVLDGQIFSGQSDGMEMGLERDLETGGQSKGTMACASRDNDQRCEKHSFSTGFHSCLSGPGLLLAGF